MLIDIIYYFFIVCASVQLLYILVIATKIIFHSSKLSVNSLEPVSVIVCARNEEANLHRLLPALTTQKYPDYEIIIVNDRSSDGTYDYLLTQEKLIPNLKLVNISTLPEKMDPKKFAITMGIKAATYENLLFTDADCVPMSNDWILHMQSKLKNNIEIVLGISQYESKNSILNLFIRYETLVTAISYISMAIAGMPYMGVGRNLAYKKSLFFKHKGFHSIMDVTGGDDDLFINQAAYGRNTEIVIDPSSHTLSIPKQTLAEWLAQKTRHIAVSRFYTFKNKLLTGTLITTQIFTYISGLMLCMTPYCDYAFITLFFRIMLLNIVFAFIISKLRYNFKWYLVPFFDILYTLYMSIVGLRAMYVKEIKWK
ncbi:MAG: glycosyltransferase [Cytophagales bacterium]|nr:glycosyltransferase [Cytophagales bacterium]